MKMKVYQVKSISYSGEQDRNYGLYRLREDAEQKLKELEIEAMEDAAYGLDYVLAVVTLEVK